MKAQETAPKGFAEAVSARFPGLIGNIRDLIETSEKAFTAKSGGPEGSFLWEHTLHVASQAYRLALAEGVDPVLAAVVALFHDAGKFIEGEYHKVDRAEEEDAVLLARRELQREAAGIRFSRGVERALSALYSERARRDRVADIVHDSDFLVKFGSTGVASFFIKSTLRGRTLDEAILGALSKDLTYAAVLPRTMRTEAGRKAAVGKSRASLRFFRSLLDELESLHGTRYRTMPASVPILGSKKSAARVRLVVPAACFSCGGAWAVSLEVEKGLKCRKLNAILRCRRCGAERSQAFCLPEVIGPGT